MLYLLLTFSGLSKVYTFGPTFRADKSHTRRHLAEFYMLEVEMCFLESLNDLLVLLENLYKCITSELLEKCAEDIGFLHKQVKIDLKVSLTLQILGRYVPYSSACIHLHLNRQS